MGTFLRPASEFEQLPVVQTHIEAAAAMMGRAKAGDFYDEMCNRLAANDGGPLQPVLAFDSPLEALFWVWWTGASRLRLIPRLYAVLQPHVFVTVPSADGADQQTFNIDYVIGCTKLDRPWPKIGVELDGHAFHEKTLEQVTYRNQRDRALQQAGWHIFHFSWEEFTTRPEESVWEVIEFLDSAYRARLALETNGNGVAG